MEAGLRPHIQVTEPWERTLSQSCPWRLESCSTGVMYHSHRGSVWCSGCVFSLSDTSSQVHCSHCSSGEWQHSCCIFFSHWVAAEHCGLWLMGRDHTVQVYTVLFLLTWDYADFEWWCMYYDDDMSLIPMNLWIWDLYRYCDLISLKTI